jgi:hypothetical protein
MAATVELDFDAIEISTQTIIAKTNWKININELFVHLPITPYEVIPKKRGRRPKEEKKVEPTPLNDGDIITLKLGDKLRGVDLKMKKKSGDNYFRNSITVVMFCEGKLINFKISKNGKFQFTGCKIDSHPHRCLEFVRSYIYPVQDRLERKIMTLPAQTALDVIYITVMSNINFSLGFCINKENLNEYIYRNTEHNSLLETTFGYTGVNIKMEIPDVSDIPVQRAVYDDVAGVWTESIITYAAYLQMLEERERVKEESKHRYVTLLVFQSGNVIESAPHKACMKPAYRSFINLITQCRSFIEEKIE